MKYRKIIIVLMCFVLIMSNDLAYVAAADNVGTDDDYPGYSTSSSYNTYGDYRYINVAGGAYIIGYTGTAIELTIPTKINGKKVIGLYTECFGGADTLKKIIIPNTVNSIYSDTFFNCRNLEEIEVASDNTTYTSENGILYSKDFVYLVTCPEGRKGEVSINENTQYVCDRSFFNCHKVTSIYIPASVFDIGEMAFYETSMLSNFNISRNNKYFVYEDGIVYNTDKTELIKCIDTKNSCVNIASTVKSIRNYAFFQCKNIIGPISFPEGLTSIGEYAFANCSNLDGQIIFPNSLNNIGKCAFYGCNKIENIVFSSGLTGIPDDCFGYCYGLKNITIPSNIRRIGERAFFKCKNVESIKLNNGIVKIGNWAFDYLKSLKGNVEIPDSVENLGDCAFEHSPLIDGYIVLGSGLKNVGDSVFYESNNSKGIVFNGEIPAISQYTFIRPSIPYYHLDGKEGFDVIKDKEVYTYSANPTVRFIINGEEYSNIVLSSYGQTISEFDTPVLENYILEGWYYDAEFTRPYDFSDIIMNDINIYAKVSPKNEIKFNQNSIIIEEGKTLQLGYTYSLEEGATEDDIVWESSNEDVATVDKKGNVTANLKGEIVITASYKNAKASIYVTVFKDQNSLLFDNKEDSRIVIGEQKQLNLIYHLIGEGKYDDIIWKSSDENIATVENGVVSAISEGTVTITASYEDVEDSIELQIVKSNHLETSEKEIILKENDSKKVNLDYYFNDGATLEDVIWSSSESSVASVNNGVVTAKSVGQATITAKYKDVSDTINVTVVGEDKIDFKDKILNVENTNKEYTIDYDFYSYDYDASQIEWTSSNENVATIESGVLTIKSNGQTIITAKVGNKVSRITVNVVNPNRLEVIQDSLDIEYRKDTKIEMDIDYYFNDNGTIDDIEYESSNKDVVEVVDNKLVLKGCGKSTILVKYKNVSDTIDINVVSIDKLSFKKNGYIVGVGKFQNLEYIFDSYEGDSQNITFTSKDNNIARVENGKVIGVNEGRTQITAKYNDMEATINIVVAKESYLLGDLDFNEIVDANDAAVALDMYKNSVSDEKLILIGDLDFNEMVDANDAALILDVYKYGK